MISRGAKKIKAIARQVVCVLSFYLLKLCVKLKSNIFTKVDFYKQKQQQRQ